MTGGKSLQQFCALCVFFCFISCEEENEVYDYSRNKPVTGELFLKEYWESNDLYYSFEYGGEDTLRGITFHGTREIPYTINYNDSTGLPVSLSATYRQYQLKMHLQYDSGLLRTFTFTVNDQKDFEVALYYDSLDRIVKTIWTSDFLLNNIHRDFEWEGRNIAVMREYPEGGDPETTMFRLEYEYDQKTNPFATVFKKMGYNIADNIPLCESNWTLLKIYQGESNNPVFTVRNSFTYWGYGYPYERFAEAEERGGKRDEPVYSTFIYR